MDISSINSTLVNLQISVAVLNNEMHLVMGIMALIGIIIMTDFIWRLIAKAKKGLPPEPYGQ